MKTASKIATLVFLACAASGSLAHAAVQNSGTILSPKRVWTERAATIETERKQAPHIAPDGCAARIAPNPTATCPTFAAISRNGTPVRVIHIYNVRPVAVCVPSSQHNCTVGR